MTRQWPMPTNLPGRHLDPIVPLLQRWYKDYPDLLAIAAAGINNICEHVAKCAPDLGPGIEWFADIAYCGQMVFGIGLIELNGAKCVLFRSIRLCLPRPPGRGERTSAPQGQCMVLKEWACTFVPRNRTLNKLRFDHLGAIAKTVRLHFPLSQNPEPVPDVLSETIEASDGRADDPVAQDGVRAYRMFLPQHVPRTRTDPQILDTCKLGKANNMKIDLELFLDIMPLSGECGTKFHMTDTTFASTQDWVREETGPLYADIKAFHDVDGRGARYSAIDKGRERWRFQPCDDHNGIVRHLAAIATLTTMGRPSPAGLC